MRTPLLIASLFFLSAASAQEFGTATPPAFGRELPRTELTPCPTLEEALAAPRESTYKREVYGWTRETADGSIRFSTTFAKPFAWANRQVLLHVPAAPAEYEVRVNGKTVGRNDNGNDPADFNITPFAEEGANTVEIIAADPAASASAPLESWRDGSEEATIGGTYVFSQPTLRVRDVLSRSTLGDDGQLHVEIALVVRTHSLNPRTSRIHYDLRSPADESIAAGYRDITLEMRGEDTLRFTAAIPLTLAWSAEQPTCYTLRLRTQHEGRNVEFQAIRLGFRTFEADPTGRAFVNGRPVQLVAARVSPDIDEYTVATLRERGYNTLQLRPGTVPQRLYRDCDLLGMYVIPCAAIDTSHSGESRRKGGNPSNDPARKTEYLNRTLDRYHTSKIHPSVIAFSIGEGSANGINLYESYLSLKKIETERPVIYPDAAGEWNSDNLQLEYPPQREEY